ncbi:MAG: AraC family transcriptional regulator [Candidatus Sumerlaeota bacterium]
MTLSTIEGARIQTAGLELLREWCANEMESLFFEIWGTHRGTVAPEWRIRDRVLEGHLLMLILSGSCDYTIDGKTYRLQPNTLLWMTEGVRNACEQLGRRDYVFSVLRYNVMGRKTGTPAIAAEPPQWGAIALAGADAMEVNALFAEADRQFRLSKWSEDGGLWVADGLVRGILGVFLRLLREEISSPGRDRRITKARRYMTENHGVEVTVEELARRAGLSVRHFAKLFREQTGQSPKEYLLEKRMHSAKFLLQDSGMTVKECAFLLGYSDPFVFSRQFKRVIGVTPSACTPGP